MYFKIFCYQKYRLVFFLSSVFLVVRINLTQEKFHTYCFPRSLGWDLFRLIQVLPGIFMYVLGLTVCFFFSQIYHVCLQICLVTQIPICLQRKKKKKNYLFCPVSSPHAWQFSHFCHKCKCLQVIYDSVYFSLFFWTSLNVLFSAYRKCRYSKLIVMWNLTWPVCLTPRC